MTSLHNHSKGHLKRSARTMISAPADVAISVTVETQSKTTSCPTGMVYFANCGSQMGPMKLAGSLAEHETTRAAVPWDRAASAGSSGAAPSAPTKNARGGPKIVSETVELTAEARWYLRWKGRSRVLRVSRGGRTAR